MSVKRALISVSDKTNLLAFAQGLVDLNIEILSTGGTSKMLRDAQIPVRDVAELTGFPEMMDGRVKTLHPHVHGGILGKRDAHAVVAKEFNICWIDLVVVNLYPFAETIKKTDVTWDEAIENIDIGGPAMIRSAAKNMEWVGVIVDPNDYDAVLSELKLQNQLSRQKRKELAFKAFQHTANYDGVIADYLRLSSLSAAKDLLSSAAMYDGRSFAALKDDNQCNEMKKFADLRYGENPHQTATAYQFSNSSSGVLSAKQHQGKQLSFNNITDADAALACVREFSQPACVIVKHANPCGAAIADDIENAFQSAFEADSIAAFGGIIALNKTCTKELARKITNIFFEVLIAPAYEKEALEIFSAKPNLRVLELDMSRNENNKELKFIDGGVLMQDKDLTVLEKNNLKIVTKAQPSQADFETMLFAWPVLKHVKSNGIIIAKENSTISIGAGQVSRIDAVDIAVRKAGEKAQQAILASDAFFPFRDSIDRLAHTGIRAIIQPGGSMRDEEVIAACDEHGIAMVFTGIRCFKH